LLRNYGKTNGVEREILSLTDFFSASGLFFSSFYGIFFEQKGLILVFTDFSHVLSNLHL